MGEPAPVTPGIDALRLVHLSNKVKAIYMLSMRGQHMALSSCRAMTVPISMCVLYMRIM